MTRHSTPRWALVQYRKAGDGTTRVGISTSGVVHEAPVEIAGLTMVQLLDEWDQYEPLLRELSKATGTDGSAARGLSEVVEDIDLLAPLTFPRKVLCSGANYYDHAQEMGTSRPDPTAEPFFFGKAPSVSIVGPGSSVSLPKGAGTNLDWEAELGVVISRRCHNIQIEDAPRHIAGYVVANDLSDRGSFPRENAVFPPFSWDWLAHKSFNGSCPLGAELVPAWEVADPQALDLSLTVNGETRQSSNTSQMVVGVNGLIAAASRLMTLEPGDLILTGTPAGVGMPKGTFLVAGDEVVAAINNIGQTTTYITEKP